MVQIYLAIFELKRRTFKFRAILPIQLLTRLNLNDVLTIEGLDYRINKFETNLLTGSTQLELINGFDTKLDKGVYLPSSLSVGKEANECSFNVPKISEYTVSFNDIGFGTSWLATNTSNSDNDNILTIQFYSWSVTSSDTYRSIELQLERDGVITRMTITQENYYNTIN